MIKGIFSMFFLNNNSQKEIFKYSLASLITLMTMFEINKVNALTITGTETEYNFSLTFSNLPEGNNVAAWNSTINQYLYSSPVLNPTIPNGTPLNLKYWELNFTYGNGSYSVLARHLIDPHNSQAANLAFVGGNFQLPFAPPLFQQTFFEEHSDSQGKHQDGYIINYSPVSKDIVVSGVHCSCNSFKFSSFGLAIIKFPIFIGQTCSRSCITVPEPKLTGGIIVGFLGFLWLKQKKRLMINFQMKDKNKN